MAAGADVAATTDHGLFHGAPPPAAAAADAVADHRKESLLELRGNGATACKKKKTPEHR